jgi:hypothetical protein
MRTEKRCGQFRIKSAGGGWNYSIDRAFRLNSSCDLLWFSEGSWWASRSMTKAEDYRRYAAECLRLAQQPSRSQAEVTLLLEMAEQAASRNEQSDGSC